MRLVHAGQELLTVEPAGVRRSVAARMVETPFVSGDEVVSIEMDTLLRVG